MNAGELATKYGNKLVGLRAWTYPAGDYPGGVAVITAVYPDPEAPEIALNVRHPKVGEIGTFRYEEMFLIDEISDDQES